MQEMKTSLNLISATNVSALLDEDEEETILLTGLPLFKILKDVFPNLPGE
jgi:hypothetical protein